MMDNCKTLHVVITYQRHMYLPMVCVRVKGKDSTQGKTIWRIMLTVAVLYSRELVQNYSI